MPHAALWVVQQLGTVALSGTIGSFNAARGFVGGAASAGHDCESACKRFNAARGFVGGAAAISAFANTLRGLFQCRTRLCGWCSNDVVVADVMRSGVSMPHAALWVVQLRRSQPLSP